MSTARTKENAPARDAKRTANAALNRLERGRARRPRSGPVELVVHVTDACTFSCAMCMNADTPVEWPAEGRHQPGPSFDTATFDELLDSWPTARAVCFAGVGEPLLNPDVRAMVARAHAVGLHTEIITNGTELESNAEWLSDGSVDSVSISINAWDGTSAEKHCGVSSATFDRVAAGVARLQSLKAATGHPREFSASAVVWKDRREDAVQIVDIASRWGIASLSLHELIPSSMPGFGSDQMLDPTDLPWMEELRALAAEKGVAVTIPELVTVGPPTSACTSPWRSLYVDAAGGVSGCMRVEAPALSNGTWRDRGVWTGEYFSDLRAAHLGDSEVPDRCRYCVEAHRGEA